MAALILSPRSTGTTNIETKTQSIDKKNLTVTEKKENHKDTELKFKKKFLKISIDNSSNINNLIVWFKLVCVCHKIPVYHRMQAKTVVLAVSISVKKRGR